jgi:ribosomal protein S21
MKWLEEDNCNNAPKRTKVHAERQREYTETRKNLFAEYMNNYRKRKAQETRTLLVRRRASRLVRMYLLIQALFVQNGHK